MYQVFYLPVAQGDMISAALYIRNSLGNPIAALKLTEEIIVAVEDLQEFPYAYPLYYPRKPLKHDFRKLTVQNYIVFYWVDEGTRTVTVARVIYARRDYDHLLTDSLLKN